MTGAVIPISQQGMVATIPTTLVTITLPLSLCNLTSFTVVYYLTVKEEWGRLTSVTLLSSPTVNRTSSSITDPTPTTPTGLGNPPQKQPCCQPCLKDEMGKLLQGRDCGFTIRQRKSPITHVNTCLPLRL